MEYEKKDAGDWGRLDRTLSEGEEEPEPYIHVGGASPASGLSPHGHHL